MLLLNLHGIQMDDDDLNHINHINHINDHDLKSHQLSNMDSVSVSSSVNIVEKKPSLTSINEETEQYIKAQGIKTEDAE